MNNIDEINALPLICFKIDSGDFVIGHMDKELGESFDDVHNLYIRNPATLVSVDGSLIITKWNPFSRNDYIPVPVQKMVYVDSPNDFLVSKYLTFTYPDLFPNLNNHLPSKTDTIH